MEQAIKHELVPENKSKILYVDLTKLPSLPSKSRDFKGQRPTSQITDEIIDYKINIPDNENINFYQT